MEQFETELAGLKLLSELSGVLTPTLIGTVQVEGGVIMVLEAVQAIERTSKDVIQQVEKLILRVPE